MCIFKERNQYSCVIKASYSGLVWLFPCGVIWLDFLSPVFPVGRWGLWLDEVKLEGDGIVSKNEDKKLILGGRQGI